MGTCSSGFFSSVICGGGLVPRTERTLRCLTSTCGLCVLSGKFERLRRRGVHSTNIRKCFGGVILSRSVKMRGPFPRVFCFTVSTARSRLRASLVVKSG